MTETSLNGRCILIVEDDDFKYEQLASFVRSRWPLGSIVHAASVRSALEKLRAQRWDLILLDMALPGRQMARGEATPMSLISGGTEVIEELAFDSRDDPVLIVTQYPEVRFDGVPHKLSEICEKIDASRSYRPLGAVLFERNGDSWKTEIEKVLKAL